MDDGHAWINSGIQVAWTSRAIPHDLADVFDAVWDELQTEPAWRAWTLRHEKAVKGNAVFNYLEVGDHNAVSITDRRGDLSYRVPVSYFEVPDVPRACRILIRALHEVRATWAGVDPPPAV